MSHGLIDWETMRDGHEKRQAYYCSPQWGQLRRQVIERSGGLCERCDMRRGTAVHHLTYIRLYREKLTDLMHICKDCHEYTHGISRKRSYGDPRLSPPWRETIIGDISERHADELMAVIKFWLRNNPSRVGDIISVKVEYGEVCIEANFGISQADLDEMQDFWSRMYDK
jgi:hypothetical protein